MADCEHPLVRRNGKTGPGMEALRRAPTDPPDARTQSYTGMESKATKGNYASRHDPTIASMDCRLPWQLCQEGIHFPEDVGFVRPENKVIGIL